MLTLRVTEEGKSVGLEERVEEGQKSTELWEEGSVFLALCAVHSVNISSSVGY